ncbi:MAG: alkaline phosphatase family protein, partial [Candidatus Eremiobacteraeota bacterium]|nr:alkaline phosphatase family protein [Candidatus Eremiobacteraeota bacterium]
KILAEHGVSSHIVRVPVSWPPEEFDGFLLSSMGTPDLMGTQGTYTLFSAGPERELTHGVFVQLRRAETAYLGEIEGPGKESVAFEFDGASLTLHGRRHTLSPGRHSPWIEVRFKSCAGLAKFLLLSEDSFYMTALQIHPGKPASSLSHPRIFSVALARLLGNFATCGLAEDLGGCDDRILSLDAFLQQAYEIHEEREKQFFHCLGRTRSGVCAVVFDGTDRIQHMTRNEEHLRELYQRMDELVGRTRAELGPNDALVVLSDHGFKPLLKLIDLNAWLLENGYLFLTEDEIDWTRTKAYTLGLAGISLNLTGREKQGVVSTDQAPLLRQELAHKLSALKDEDVSPIESVSESCKIYHGPYAPNAPDLIIGYKPGYGVHKEAARGRVGTTVVVDNDNPWVADHCYHADLVPGVLFSTLDLSEEASLVDLAPTVLELFGIEPVDFHDGRSLLREAS